MRSAVKDLQTLRNKELWRSLPDYEVEAIVEYWVDKALNAEEKIDKLRDLINKLLKQR
jgi:hypothetical protein